MLKYEEVMKSEEVGEVLGLLVHEMKTGLSVMLGSLEMWGWDYPEEMKDKRLRDTMLFGHYLAGVLDGLYEVSRTSRGGERERESFVLREVVEEVVALVGTMVDDRRVEVRGADVRLRGSRLLWREMVFGLVVNGLVHGKGDVALVCGGEEGVLGVGNGGEWEDDGSEVVRGGLGIVKMLAVVEGVSLCIRRGRGEVWVWLSV